MYWIIGVGGFVGTMMVIAGLVGWRAMGRAMARRLDPPPAAKAESPERAERRKAAEVPQTRVRDGRLEMWPPYAGGWACAETDPRRPGGICGRSVEDEPCDNSHGAVEALTDLV